MTAAILRCGFVASVLLVGFACGTADQPTAPSAMAPLLPAGSQRYDFSAPLTYAVTDYTKTSRYVLGPSRNFALQYPSLGRDFVGRYEQDGDRISFHFAVDSRWEATGMLNGDSLTVEYNLIMGLSDFDNAIYKRAP